MYIHRFMIVALALLLSACSGPKLDVLRKADMPEDPFLATLATQYRGLSEAAAGAQRFTAAQFYAQKGLDAAYGKDVGPENPTDWVHDPAGVEELTEARMQLLAALTEPAKRQSPRAAANALAFYDCWTEQSGNGLTDAAICKQGFAEAMSALTRPALPVEAGVPRDVALSTSFLIFFGWDEAMLGGDALQAISKVLAYVKNLKDSGYEIVVNGHTDTSGEDSYNLTLSNSRADVVKEALVEAGMLAEKITTYGFGETDPRVKTPDGVREPANRRVEIFIE